MTYEAEVAREVSYQFECKKDALRQVQDGGVKVTFTINPLDMPAALYGDPMGQRYMAVIVPVNGDETPRGEPEEQTKKNYTASAKMLTQNEKFHQFISDTGRQEQARKQLKIPHPRVFPSASGLAHGAIYSACGVTSCADIKDGTEAGRKFARLYAEFQEWLNN